MKLRLYLSFALALAFGSLWYAPAQKPTILINEPGQVPNVAVTDFRATGGAQPFMAAFNATVLADLQGSPLVKSSQDAIPFAVSPNGYRSSAGGS